MYGSDRACVAIARAAAADGFDVHVVVPYAGPLVPQLRETGATVHVFDPLVLRRSDLRGLRAPRTLLRWTRAVASLERFARVQRFDLVHSNCVTTVGGSYLAWRWRVPHIWHVHELFQDDGTARVVFERLLRRADRIVAASDAVASQFRSPALRARSVVARTGADVPADMPTVQPLARAEARVVCVGRLNAWKGQDDLIRAVGLLRDRGVDVQLHVVGAVFADEHRFRARLVDLMAELDLGDRVRFLGQRDDALALMAQSDVAVVPSASPEPFGMVVIEAMALGRPVIATDAGGPREIISDGEDGLLVPPRDPEALADAIARLVADPEAARRLGRRARETAQRFTTTAMATRVLQTYDDLLSRAV